MLTSHGLMGLSCRRDKNQKSAIQNFICLNFICLNFICCKKLQRQAEIRCNLLQPGVQTFVG